MYLTHILLEDYACAPAQMRACRPLSKESASDASVCQTVPLTLRPYLTDVVDNLRAAFRMGYRALLLQLAMAGGKTIIFVAIIVSGHRRGKRILAVADSRELICQASAKLTAAGVPHGIILK
jgi:superfamily II DNA or RNA helicase